MRAHATCAMIDRRPDPGDRRPHPRRGRRRRARPDAAGAARGGGALLPARGKRADGRRTSAAYYREREDGGGRLHGRLRAAAGAAPVANEEVAEAAAANPDVLIPFASIDPRRGRAGAREVRRLIEEHGVRGFKFHPTCRLLPERPAGLPALRGDRRGRGCRRSSTPARAASAPACRAAAASGSSTRTRCTSTTSPPTSRSCRSCSRTRRSPGRTRRSRSPRTSRRCYIDLSGWSPKYFPPQLVQYANTLLKRQVLFGSDYPMITPDRWLADFERLDVRRRDRAADPQGQRGAAAGPGYAG